MCAQLLAELGAHVVCVEPVVVDERQERNLWLQHARRGIIRIGLDLKSEPGREVAHRLAGRSEIVLEGFRPGVAAKLGVSFEDFTRRGHELVYTAISGYGQTGPLRLRPGHDINYIAHAGVISLVGDQNGPPVAPGILLADFGAGALFAAVATLAAFHELRNSGRGQYIDISMMDSVAHTMARFIVPALAGEPPARRGGEFLTGAAPWYGVYAASGGDYLAVGAVEEHFFAALCRTLDADAFVHSQWDEQSWPAMRTAFASSFATKGRDEWVALLGDTGCIAPVNTVTDMLTDAQLTARGVVSRDGMGPSVPVRGSTASDTLAPSTRAELTGVLEEIGFSEVDVAELERLSQLRYI